MKIKVYLTPVISFWPSSLYTGSHESYVSANQHGSCRRKRFPSVLGLSVAICSHSASSVSCGGGALRWSISGNEPG